MPLDKLQSLTEYVMFCVFGGFQVLVVIFTLLSTDYSYPSQIVFYAYQSLIISIIMSTACIVAAYSFAFFYQENNIRNLYLGVTSIALIPTSFIFLLVYPGFPIPNLIEPHNFKVQILLIILGLIIGIGMFSCSLVTQYSGVNLTEKIFIFIMDFVLPGTALGISIIPNDMIETVYSWPSLKAFAWGIEFILLGLVLASLYRFSKYWKDRENSIPTGIILFLICFLIGLFLLALPYDWGHISEILVISEVLVGFILIALGLTATTITDPHRGLTTIIRERTKELDRSRSESEFYLNIWGHELGNTLQGVISYLELIRMKRNVEDSRDMEDTALELAQRATRIVREVSELTLIKQEQITLHPVDVVEEISKTITYMQDELQLSFKASISIPNETVKIQADSLFGQIFIHLFRTIIDHSDDLPSLSIHIKKKKEIVDIIITDSSRKLSDSAVDFLRHDIPASESSISLGLFIIRNLVDRYHGDISYTRVDNKNRFKITFKNPNRTIGIRF